jgi:hypothetical protein
MLYAMAVEASNPCDSISLVSFDTVTLSYEVDGKTKLQSQNSAATAFVDSVCQRRLALGTWHPLRHRGWHRRLTAGCCRYSSRQTSSSISTCQLALAARVSFHCRAARLLSVNGEK